MSLTTIASLLFLFASPESTTTVSPGQPNDLLAETLPGLRRTLNNVELSFVRTLHFAGDSSTPEHAHSYDVGVRFSNDGYVYRSQTLDPVVTPREQMETGAVLSSGQNLTVLYDGHTELFHEDIPENEEDHVVLRPQPSMLGEEDPRQFGLCSIFVRSAESATRKDDGSIELSLAGGQTVTAWVDEKTMTCQRLLIRGCSGAVIGEYLFSGFQHLEALGSSNVYPLRTELRKYDSRGSDGVVYRSTWILKDARRVEPADIWTELRDHPVPAESLVQDYRRTPAAHYIAGRRGGPPVTLAFMGATLLDRLEGGEAHDHDHIAATAATVSSGTDPLITTLVLLAIGALLLLRSRGRRLFNVAAVLLLTLPAGAMAEEITALELSHSELTWTDVSDHDVLQREILIKNPSQSPINVTASASSSFLSVWPQKMVLEGGASASLTVFLTVPSGSEAVDSSIHLVADTLPQGKNIAIRASRKSVNTTATETAPATVAPAGPQPQLSAESWVQKAGPMLDSDVVKISFPFRNQGDADLVIRDLHAECGCTQPAVDQDVIAAGEEGVLTVTFAPENRAGNVERKIFMVSNDPVTPIASFIIQSEVISEIEFQPGQLDLGRLQPGEESTSFLTLNYKKEAPRLKKLESNNLRLVDQATLDEASGSQTYAVILSTDSHQGNVEGELLFNFEGRKHPLRIKYRGLVRGSAFTQPEQLGFAFIDGTNPGETYLDFGVRAEKGGAVESLQYDRLLLSVEEITSIGGERARYRVRPSDSCPDGFFNTTVRLQTSWQTTPLIVPVRGFVVAEDAVSGKETR